MEHVTHFTLLDHLHIFWGSECHDPRDKLYAPLCLASEEVRKQMRPNYTDKNALDVYMDLARCYISSAGAGSLDFLGLAWFEQDPAPVVTPDGRESVLPSWVPNLWVDPGVFPMPKTLHIQKHPNLERNLFKNLSGLPTPLSLRRNLRAAASTQIPAYKPLEGVTPASYINGNELFVQGVLVDFIQDTTDFLSEEVNKYEDKPKTTHWAALMNNRYFTGESPKEVYSHSFVIDLVYDEWGRPGARGGVFAEDLPSEPWQISSVDELRRQQIHAIALRIAMSQRELALTDSHFVAVVPKTVKAGDSIWALAGGQVLYVLRDVDPGQNQYKFIGESYVHGLMDGTISAQLREGLVPLRQISLV